MSIERWDWLAGALLVREAGGTVEELPSVSGSGVLATGSGIFAQLRALVRT